MTNTNFASHDNTVKIGFVGDISLNGGYCDKDISFLNRVFSDIRQFLNANRVDFLIGNLESPLEGDGSENLLKKPRTKSTKKSLHALKTLSPDILILGNNHVYDCLEKGYDNTTSWLNENGIRHVGACRKSHETSSSCRFLIKGQQFSLLSYVAEDTNPSLPDGADIKLNMLDPEEVINDIKKEAKDSFVIVSLHWGIEFSHYPSPYQIKLAYSFIDAGAGIIMGHHTHTLQGMEKYNDAWIFYSLGNFAFDDVVDADNAVLWNTDQKHGGLAIADIIDGKIISSELHVTVNKELNVGIDNTTLWKKKIHKRSKILKKNEKGYQRFWLIYQVMDSILLPPLRFFFGERKKFSEQVRSIRLVHLNKVLNYIKTYKNNTTKESRHV